MKREVNPNKKPRIVAVIGAMGAGKDALVDYLGQRQHQVMTIEVGTFARQLSREADENEPHLQYDVSAKHLAEHEPEYIIQRLVAEIIETGQPPTNSLVITGICTPAEAATLKAHFGPDLLLVYIKGGGKKRRYERVQKRDFATEPDEFQDFVQQDERMKSEHALEETIALADVTLWNDGPLEAFHRQIETHIVRHLFPER